MLHRPHPRRHPRPSRRRPHRARFAQLAALVSVCLGALWPAPAPAFDVARSPAGEVARFSSPVVDVYLATELPSELAATAWLAAVEDAVATVNALGAGVTLRLTGWTAAPPRRGIFLSFAFSRFAADSPDVAAATTRYIEGGVITRAEVLLDGVHSIWAPLLIGDDAFVVDPAAVATQQLARALGLEASPDVRSPFSFFVTAGPTRTPLEDDVAGLRWLYRGSVDGSPDEPLGTSGFCDACAAHDDCAGGVCTRWPDGRAYCTPPCDDSTDCPLGASCGAVGEALRCLPNAGHCHPLLGAAAVGETCASDRMCQAGTLCLPESGGAFCAQPCGDGCPAESFCSVAGVDGVGPICVRGGPQAPGEPCTNAMECGALACAPGSGSGTCALPCTDNSQCPPGQACSATGLCQSPGDSPLTFPCESDLDCTTSTCADASGGFFERVCAVTCATALDCPEGTGCTQTAPPDLRQLCLPFGPSPRGGPCMTTGMCAAGLGCDLGPDDAVGRCVEACDPFSDTASCAGGERCVYADAESSPPGRCRKSGAGGLPGATCSADAQCRVDLVCAGVGAESNGGVCRAVCEPGGAPCADGLPCGALVGGAAPGACGTAVDGYVALLPRSPEAPSTTANHLAREVRIDGLRPVDEPFEAERPVAGGCSVGRPRPGGEHRGGDGTAEVPWLGLLPILALYLARSRPQRVGVAGARVAMAVDEQRGRAGDLRA